MSSIEELENMINILFEDSPAYHNDWELKRIYSDFLEWEQKDSGVSVIMFISKKYRTETGVIKIWGVMEINPNGISTLQEFGSINFAFQQAKRFIEPYSEPDF